MYLFAGVTNFENAGTQVENNYRKKILLTKLLISLR